MDAAVTRKCEKPVCDSAEPCAVEADQALAPPAAKRTKAKTRTPKPRQTVILNAGPAEATPAPTVAPAAPSAEAAPAVTTGQAVKTGLGEVHWQKQEAAGILDGRESLFLKVWNAISSFQMPKAPARPKAPKKQPATEVDPYADLFG
ncbi:conserved hypothetical protein [Magnetospirillum sp. SS-4]|nr:conserved hypothetical protein [Magnetospirillum sp. SS-4]